MGVKKIYCLIAVNLLMSLSVYGNGYFMPSLGDFKKSYTEGNYLDAIKYGKAYLEESNALQTVEYAKFLDNLAECESELEDYSSALLHLKTSLKIKKKECGKKSLEYALTLNYLAKCYLYMGNGNDARKTEREAYNIAKRVLDKNSEEYYFFLLNYAGYLDDETAYDIANDYVNKKDSYGILSAEAFSIMSNYLSAQTKYDDSIDVLYKALQIRKKLEGPSHIHCAVVLNDLADCYFRKNDYNRALELYEEANSIYKNAGGEDYINYIYTLASMGRLQGMLNNYLEAESLLLKAFFLTNKKYGSDSFEYAVLSQQLAFVKNLMEDTESAIFYQEQAINYFENNDMYIDENELIGLLNLFSFYADASYSDARRNDDAILTFNKYLNLVRERYGEDNWLFAMGLSTYAEWIGDKGNVKGAIRDLDRAISIYKRIDGDNDVLIAENLYASAYLYSSLSPDSSIVRLKEVLSIYEERVGSSNKKYISALGLLTDCYFLVKDYSHATAMLSNYFNLKKQRAIRAFVSLDKKERTSFWETYEYSFNKMLPVMGFNINDSITNRINYDLLLLKKGLLLNAELAHSDLMAESHDEDVIKLYKELQLNTKIEDSYLNDISNISREELEKLENNIANLEHQLSDKSAVFKALEDRLLVNYKEVQKRLGKDDVAIEFEIVPLADDEILYCAFVLKTDSHSPKMVPLFELKSLQDISKNDYYDKITVSNLIWRPLAEELKGVVNVYFAPIGELYGINIESLPHFDGDGFMSDYYNMFRLSSTRELVYHSKERKGDKAVVYGGLKYNMSIEEMGKDIIKFKDETRGDTKTPYIDSLRLREGVVFYSLPYLPETKSEIDEIRDIINKSKTYDIIQFDGVNGTETSFKSLSSKRPVIIHIATHGFYYSEEEAEKYRYIKNLYNFRKNRGFDNEDKALTRTGLYFSGADHIRMGEAVPDSIDDGVLTAYEIAQLDLRGLDLVVLSACQTAQGDINGDGVFGLQRGFKKAGANSILMSLWNVDDFATRLLMTEFYRNYLSGINKQESLKMAQDYVRNYEDEAGNSIFSDPYYWASFILLDGLY